MFTERKLSLAISSIVALYASAAAAQDPSQGPVLEEVVVTGSQIRGLDVAGSMPVTVLGEEDIATTGSFDGDELLRAIPQIGSVGFGASRGGITGVNAARGDVGSVNLRSIGEGNTLVLMNGRRMVLHPITQTSSIDGVPIATVNSNVVPVNGVQRVEVLRDGAGPLYGSDAVAGVVNYIMKTDYEGSEFGVRFGSEQGTDRDDIDVTGVTGFDFNNGATNLTLSGTYAKRNGVDASDKSYARNQDLRPLPPQEFASDLNLDQRSSLEPWALVSYDQIGRIHVRPTDLNLIWSSGVVVNQPAA